MHISRQLRRSQSFIHMFMLGLCALANAPSNAQDTQGHPLYVLDYVDGENWIQGKDPGEQDMSAHFEYVTALSRAEQLVGNGLLEDRRPHGLYLLDVPALGDARKIVARDPATTSGVLNALPLKTWIVVMDGFAHANKAKGSFFILDYHHGPNWKAGASLMEQDVAHHLSYVGGLFASGRLIGGGPIVEENRGMYLLKTPHRAMVNGIVAADPGVKAGIFDVSIREWSPGKLQALERSKTVAQNR